MATEKDEKELFTDQAKNRLASKTSEILNDVQKEIEEQKDKETKSGRKSKDAKIAEEAEIWSGILQPILSGINSGVASYAKELAHSDEEIQTIAVLSGKIAPKYLDIDMMKFKEEYMLASYLIMIETQKIQNYLESRENREKSKGSNNDTGKTGKWKDLSDNKSDNSESS